MNRYAWKMVKRPKRTTSQWNWPPFDIPQPCKGFGRRSPLTINPSFRLGKVFFASSKACKRIAFVVANGIMTSSVGRVYLFINVGLAEGLWFGGDPCTVYWWKKVESPAFPAITNMPGILVLYLEAGSPRCDEVSMCSMYVVCDFGSTYKGPLFRSKSVSTQ